MYIYIYVLYTYSIFAPRAFHTRQVNPLQGGMFQIHWKALRGAGSWCKCGRKSTEPPRLLESFGGMLFSVGLGRAGVTQTNCWSNTFNWLVVTGTMEFYDFPYIGNVMIPTDFHIFSEGFESNHQPVKI